VFVDLWHGSRRQKSVTPLACVVAIGLVVSGCSSSPRAPVGAGLLAGRVPPPAPPSAVALAHRLLDDPILPAGVKPYAGPLPRSLASDPAPTPANLVNLVPAHRLWTMRSTAANVAGFLQKHRPRGFTGNGVVSPGALRYKTDRALYTDNQLAVLPTSISNAQLDVSVSDAGVGNVVIRVDSIVAWTKPRPQAEFASAQDRVVTLTVIHLGSPKPGKRVVATKADLVQPILWSFNQLRLSAPAKFGECPPGGRGLSYQVAFARSPDATPDVVASMDLCDGVRATAGKQALPELDPSGAFAKSVAHLLGTSELHY
jgi:hypothetical protein